MRILIIALNIETLYRRCTNYSKQIVCNRSARMFAYWFSLFYKSIVRSGEFGGHADVMHLAKLVVTIIESNVLKLEPSTQVADHICPNNK